MTKDHELRLHGGHVVMSITETPRYVETKLTVIKHTRKEDQPQVDEWLRKVVGPYYDDPRPLVMVHPHTGDRFVTSTNGCIIIPPPANRN